MIFQSERLIVRCLEERDFDSFDQMQSDHTVMRYTTGRGFSREENRKQFDECLLCFGISGNQFWVWAIESKLDQRFVET